MSIHSLIADSYDFIEEQIKGAQNPAVAWSGGKDSQIVLHLAYSIKPDIPVVYFKGIDHPTKHAFMSRVAHDWNLNLCMPLPMGRDALRAADGRIEIIEVYRVGERATMYFPLESEPGYVPDENAICGREHLEGQVSTDIPDYDAILIGHRSDDVDPTHGAVPLRDYVVEHQGFRYIYPLRDWTESDIWEASRILNVPQNKARYIDHDMSHNADYFELCTACLSGPTRCPKTGQDIPQHSTGLDLDANREAWRQTFVNIG